MAEKKKCTFSVEFAGSAEALAARVRQAITGGGGQFEGDAASGCFTIPSPMGQVQGHYQIAASSIEIELTKKPRAVPCRRIETMLAAFLAT